MSITPISPANRSSGSERKRIPMSVPVQKLAVPDIPGFHLHWFNGTPDRIQRALDGGYEFVEETETSVPDAGLGGTSTRTGNTDLGTRVSVVGGTELDRSGQPIRMMLMKIKQEWYDEDQVLVKERNDSVIDSIIGGTQAAGAGADISNRYVDPARTNVPHFFGRKMPAKRS